MRFTAVMALLKVFLIKYVHDSLTVSWTYIACTWNYSAFPALPSTLMILCL